MPRPRKCRLVGQRPKQAFFKPRGIPMTELIGVNLPVEGLEALRLVDAKGLVHAQAAKHMKISRPTFSRILSDARRTVSHALSKGWAISIAGGNYKMMEQADDT